MSVSHLFSEALCFVVSAGRVTPESEIWYSLAHCNSPALSPVKKKKKEKEISFTGTMGFNLLGLQIFLRDSC